MRHHSAGEIETCDECRFDGREYEGIDLGGTLRNLCELGALVVDGVDPEYWNRRPAPAKWSVGEYAFHCRAVVEVWAAAIELAADPDTRHVVEGSAPPDASADDPQRSVDVYEQLGLLHDAAMRMHEVVTRLDDAGLSRTITINGATSDVLGIALHTVHDVTHHYTDMGRVLAALGAGVRPQRGTVSWIGLGSGGVPNHPVDDATIRLRGLDGDRQATRRHHGRPWQAVCCWSRSRLDGLQAEGHPISEGSIGENLILDDVDWDSLRAGARMELGGGDGPLLEFTCWADPCTQIKGAFIDGEFTRVRHSAHPGWSRIYAKVLRDGDVRLGDTADVIP